MKATLKIEVVEDRFQRVFKRLHKNSSLAQKNMYGEFPATRWVRKITGVDADGDLVFETLPRQVDCSHANSTGSRGVYEWYVLESGSVYDVRVPVNHNQSEEYYCIVNDEGDIIKIGKREVLERLKNG